jgi:hypothetical protein
MTSSLWGETLRIQDDPRGSVLHNRVPHLRGRDARRSIAIALYKALAQSDFFNVIEDGMSNKQGCNAWGGKDRRNGYIDDDDYEAHFLCPAAGNSQVASQWVPRAGRQPKHEKFICRSPHHVRLSGFLGRRHTRSPLFCAPSRH